ncbi:uncharacterized protein LOC143918709 [Arctopsyche grandis]|uniref:uncharacterized protein LOC143918709 n=1 Tax=Arctopsyche grandis TaxID=121162 RepID=UPI00406D6EB5
MDENSKADYLGLLNKLVAQERELSESVAETYFNYSNKPRLVDQDEGDRNVVNKKTCQFLEAMRQEVLEDYDQHTFDPTKNYFEAITTMKKEISEMEKCIVYKRSTIDKIDTDINFYKSNIANLEEAMKEFDAKAEIQRSQMENDNVIKAKKKFRKVRDDFNNVIHELYPNYKTFLTNFMEKICRNYFEETDDYVEIEENINVKILETLLDAGIIVAHPYHNKMFKLGL